MDEPLIPTTIPGIERMVPVLTHNVLQHVTGGMSLQRFDREQLFVHHQARRTEEEEEERLFKADAVNEEDLGLETFKFRSPGASHSLMSLKECPKP